MVYHQTATVGSPITLLAEGDIILNGVSLGELNLDSSSHTETDAKFFADYINLKSNLTGVSVTASNTIEIPLSDINLLDQER